MTAKKWLDRGVYLSSMALSALINRGKDPKSLNFNNILCIKEDEIGDFIYTLPVYAMLRKQFPAARITVLCRPFGLDLLQHCPDVDQAISQYPDARQQFDLIIDLRGTVASTLLALRRWPLYRLDRGTVRYRNRQSGQHPQEAETNWQILKVLVDERHKLLEPRLYISDSERQQAADFLRERNIGRYALFHTGARRILKKWPLERVAVIMKHLHSEFGLDCILAGDQQDAADSVQLQKMLDFPLKVAAGKVKLLTFAALCEKADFFLGNDSGPLHIAATMGTPALGLYGPGDPIFHPRQANAGFLHHILECNPCDQVHCKYPENPCILRISTGEVQTEARRLMKAKGEIR